MQGKARFVFPSFLSGVVAFLMTGYVKWLKFWLLPDFLTRWMLAWVKARPRADLSALIAARPFVAKVEGGSA
jgi:hypothetical protein